MELAEMPSRPILLFFLFCIVVPSQVLSQERTEGEHEYHGDEKEKESSYVDLGKWNLKLFGHTRVYLVVYLPD
jgi:hypothetical protein